MTPKFNRTNANIDWAAWSWNPVTGCKGGCPYCYARDIAIRFTGHFDPTFHPDRLQAPHNTNPIMGKGIGARCVFVCSMADLFGPWVPERWIEDILNAVRKAPQWTFIFLTKYPERLEGIAWPKNAWVGTTIDKQARVEPAIKAFEKMKATVRFVSCEPLLEPLKFRAMPFEWILIGGQSASGKAPAFQPEWAWVQELVVIAKRYGDKAAVYMKPNLIVPAGTERLKEYPII